MAKRITKLLTILFVVSLLCIVAVACDEEIPTTVTEYTVTFNTNGGSDIASVKVEEGKTIAEPSADPTKADSTFKGWFTTADGAEAFDFTQAISKDTTVYAQWDKVVVPTVTEYTVTFNTNGGSDIASVKVEEGKTIAEPSADPTKADSTFKGWFTTADGAEAFDFTQAISKDTTVYAQWGIGYVGKYYYEIDGMPMVYIVIDNSNFVFDGTSLDYTAMEENGVVTIAVTSPDGTAEFTLENGILTDPNNSREYIKMTNLQCAVKITLSADNSATIVVEKGKPMAGEMFTMFSSFGNLYCGDELFTASTIITEDMEIEIRVQNHEGAPYLGKYIVGTEYKDGKLEDDIFILTADMIIAGSEDPMPYSATEKDGVYTILFGGYIFEYDSATEKLTWIMIMPDGTDHGTREFSKVPANAKLVAIVNPESYGQSEQYFVTEGNNLVYVPSDNGQTPYELQDISGATFDPSTTPITKDTILTYVSLNPFNMEQDWIFEENNVVTVYKFFDKTTGSIETIDDTGASQYLYFSYVLTRNSDNSDNLDIEISYVADSANYQKQMTYIKDRNIIIDENGHEYTISVPQSTNFMDCCGEYIVENTDKVIIVNPEFIVINGEDCAILDKNLGDGAWIVTTDKIDEKSQENVVVVIYLDGALEAINNFYTKQ